MTTIFEDNNVCVFLQETNDKSEVWLVVKNHSLPLNYLDSVCRDFPRIKISNFISLKKAFDNPNVSVCIGDYKPKFAVSTSKDEMYAYIDINMTQSELESLDLNKIKTEIIAALNEEGIREGINLDSISKDMESFAKVLVAKGIEPVSGIDAKIKYFQLSEKKPTIKSDGKVDNYEMNLIDKVERGGWLGEKILPTLGQPGKTVSGKTVLAKPGRDYMLKFDAKSVDEVLEEGKINLVAKFDGAVKFEQGKIGVHNHLIIDENVGYSTGNIDFDGYVTINGVVEDLFSVRATKDIFIKGKMGIGAVGTIHSVNGDISILGGVNGKKKAKLIAGRNVYVKYVNEAEIEAKGEINIGLYAFESILKGDKVILSPDKGKIVGGDIQAKHLVSANTFGNSMEKATKIQVKGFDRNKVNEELNVIKVNFNETIAKANRLKRELEILELNQDNLSEKEEFTYKGMLLTYENLIDEINKLNYDFKKLEEFLRTKGEGEVKILGSAYPKTVLDIKNLQKVISKTMAGSFYVKDNSLHLTQI